MTGCQAAGRTESLVEAGEAIPVTAMTDGAIERARKAGVSESIIRRIQIQTADESDPSATSRALDRVALQLGNGIVGRLIAADVDIALDALAKGAQEQAEISGFTGNLDPSDPRHLASLIALGITEDCELIEELRHPTPRMSEKLPGVTAEADELADSIIRRLQYAGARGIPIGMVVLRKLAYNAKRGYKHGGKRF